MARPELHLQERQDAEPVPAWQLTLDAKQEYTFQRHHASLQAGKQGRFAHAHTKNSASTHSKAVLAWQKSFQAKFLTGDSW